MAEAWQDEPRGLLGRFRLSDSDTAQEAAHVVRDGFMTGMSVGCELHDVTWTFAKDWNPDRGPDHMDHVTIHRARLVEVSLTPTPAFAQAQVLEVSGEALQASSARPVLEGYRSRSPRSVRLAAADARALAAPVAVREPQLTTLAAWRAWRATL